MAEFMFHKGVVKVGASAALVSLSSFTKSVTITHTAEMLDKTAMGSSAKRRLAGLKDFTVAVELNQDLAVSKVDATLWPMVGSTNKHIVIKAKSSASTGVNPRYVGKVLLPSYTPIAGAVGSLAGLSVTFQGDGLMSRLTSAT